MCSRRFCDYFQHRAALQLRENGNNNNRKQKRKTLLFQDETVTCQFSEMRLFQATHEQTEVFYKTMMTLLAKLLIAFQLSPRWNANIRPHAGPASDLSRRPQTSR